MISSDFINVDWKFHLLQPIIMEESKNLHLIRLDETIAE